MRLLVPVLAALICVTTIIAPSFGHAQEGDRTRIEKFLEDQLSDTAREVRIEGFRGALSSSARMNRLTISDAEGPWLILQNARLDWQRTALLQGRLQINALSAERLEVLRPPLADDRLDLPQAEARPFSLPDLPVSIAINEIEIEEILIGEPLIGIAGRFALTGSARLDAGDGDADIALIRLDGPPDQFDLNAAYSNETSVLSIDLRLEEDAGGLLSELLNLPGRPSIRFVIRGDGPIDTFNASVELATDGEDRISGEVSTQAGAGQAINVDIAGDLRPLVTADLHPFFGDTARLFAQALISEDGSLDLREMELSTRALDISGSIAIDANGRPERLSIEGLLQDPADADDLRLPFGGARIDRAALRVAYDSATRDAVSIRVIAEDLSFDAVRIAQISLRSEPQLDPGETGLSAVAASLSTELDGIVHDDPAMAQAIGSSMVLETLAAWNTGQPLRIFGLSATAGDIAFGGGISVDFERDGLFSELDLSLQVADLSRFDGLAGQELSGSVATSLSGQIEPLSGAFDLALDGTARDLATDLDLPPDLLSGETALSIRVARDTGGLRLDQLTLGNETIALSGAGTVSAVSSDLDLDVRLADAAIFTPALRGPITADLGLARRGDAPWQLDTVIDGAGGTRLGLTGGIGLPDNTVDLQAQGRVPLALANRFIAPRSVSGDLDFDLALRGEPSLVALTGSLRSSGVRVSLPFLRAALENVGWNASIQGGRLSFDGSGTLSTGGRVAAAGRLSLAEAAFPVDLTLSLQGARIIDPELFEARIQSSEIRVSGALAGRLRVSGPVELGDSEIRVPDSGLGVAAPIPPLQYIGESGAERLTRQYAGLLRTGPSAAGPAIGLDLSINAPGRIFLRGRGIDAEFGGSVRLTGDSQNVIPIGRFDLLRGRLSILGTRLDFTEGSATLRGSFDLYLDLTAESRSGGYRIVISVTGPASSPEIRFSSAPTLPEDEVLAQLLFGRSVSALSPVQLLQLADAASTLAGGRTDSSLLTNLRTGLGLDDLDLQTDAEGNAAIRAGRYLSENIYTDLTVGSGGETGLSLNIDLTPDITARGRVSSTGETSLGIFYERDY